MNPHDITVKINHLKAGFNIHNMPPEGKYTTWNTKDDKFTDK